jgi:hypothetical protein
MRFITRISRHIIAVGLGSLALATPAFAHQDTQAGLGFRTNTVTQAGPNADQRGPAVSTANNRAVQTAQVGPNADQRGPGIDPQASSAALPTQVASTDDSSVSVLAFVLSLAGMGVIAAGGVALVSARGRGHRAGAA